MGLTPLIHVVDDDEQLRVALLRLQIGRASCRERV